ncbi:hypothetical protein RB195_017026 [Necator americanus]|uniref:Uncharacterized protein n=1 Tax=Necator americanus TaxID=51031 RepID=A0ABR1C6F5_NECAM
MVDTVRSPGQPAADSGRSGCECTNAGIWLKRLNVTREECRRILSNSALELWRGLYFEKDRLRFTNSDLRGPICYDEAPG